MAEHIQAGMAQEPPPYHYPPLDLLQEGKGELGGEALVELNANKQRLSDTIHSFGIDANIVNVTRGPSVTRYELELDQGVRLNKLTNLSDDIALSLGASGVRIAPIPGKISMVGSYEKILTHSSGNITKNAVLAAMLVGFVCRCTCRRG